MTTPRACALLLTTTLLACTQPPVAKAPTPGTTSPPAETIPPKEEPISPPPEEPISPSPEEPISSPPGESDDEEESCCVDLGRCEDKKELSGAEVRELRAHCQSVGDKDCLRLLREMSWDAQMEDELAQARSWVPFEPGAKSEQAEIAKELDKTLKERKRSGVAGRLMICQPREGCSPEQPSCVSALRPSLEQDIAEAKAQGNLSWARSLGRFLDAQQAIQRSAKRRDPRLAAILYTAAHLVAARRQSALELPSFGGGGSGGISDYPPDGVVKAIGTHVPDLLDCVPGNKPPPSLTIEVATEYLSGRFDKTRIVAATAKLSKAARGCMVQTFRQIKGPADVPHQGFTGGTFRGPSGKMTPMQIPRRYAFSLTLTDR